MEAFAEHRSDAGIRAIDAFIRRYVAEEVAAGRWVKIQRKGYVEAMPAEMARVRAQQKGGDDRVRADRGTAGAAVSGSGSSSAGSRRIPARAREATGDPCIP
jgi:hypothetical protein